MELNIIHNKESERFEASIEGMIAFIKYRQTDQLISILSTQVPKELEGRGIAAALTKFALEYARNNDLAVEPVCSYTVTYIASHPQYKELIK